LQTDLSVEAAAVAKKEGSLFGSIRHRAHGWTRHHPHAQQTNLPERDGQGQVDLRVAVLEGQAG